MVAALPHNIKQKLHQTIAQWRSWHGDTLLLAPPVVVRTLSPGLSNYSVLVESKRKFVVRIDGLNPAVIGLSRASEWRALQCASASGIAPVPRYFNPDLGSLVYDYLAPDKASDLSLESVAALLRKIHQLPPIHFRMDLRERILRHEKHIEHAGSKLPTVLTRSRESVLSLIDSASAELASPVLCHNDLLSANRITSGGRLSAIDWEYCAMGSPWFDLAVVCVGDELSASETETLLSNYLQRVPQSRERQSLAKHQCIYRYIELLWFCALEDISEREAQLTESRFRGLEDCIAALR
ncbi:MAG: thiamine kinase-like enzyme [Halioglobus sp.]|jgi:thiamine kinase